jgi:aspartyl-tRNA(Asn)/glutamyl-tRNA(Gln) amidotransferase subunit C
VGFPEERALAQAHRRMRGVIDREEVLHVARLARLKLSEDEIEPLARELSAILDHVAHIGELDLEGVAPTTHVVEMTGALRADEPWESLPREVALAQAPVVSGNGFSVPSPQA